MTRFLAFTAIFVLAAIPIQAEEQDGANRQIAKSIAAALQDAKADGRLKGSAIDVQVDRGSVWLSGEVSSREDLKTVVQIARRTNGVRRVINDLTLADGAGPGAPTPLGWPYHGQRQKVSPERVVKSVAQSIEGKREAGKLEGYDIAIEFYQGILVLEGEVADADAQNGVIASARGQAGVFCICNALKIAQAGARLSNKTTTAVAAIEQLKIPSGATWLSNEPTRAKFPLRWDDGYWQLDFELDVF